MQIEVALPNRDGDRMVGPDGKAQLFDGRSGEPLPDPVLTANQRADEHGSSPRAPRTCLRKLFST